MARTAPAPNVPPIPGMNPGTFLMGGGGSSGGGKAGGGKGSGKRAGAKGKGSGSNAKGGGKGACGGAGAGADGGGCPNHHGGKKSGTAAKGDPVDVVTGRVFTVPAVDVDLPGPLPLQIVRAYSSEATARDVGLGFGWGHSLAWEVEAGRHQTRVWTADGPVDFEPVPMGGGATGPNGWVLVRSPAGFVLDTGEDRWYVFAEGAEGRYRLSAIKDRYENPIGLRYSDGLLAEILDSAGRVVRLRRAPDGRIASFEVKNAPQRGNWVALARYLYDRAGDLVSATDADDYATSFAYGPDHLLASHTSPTGLSFYFRYDAQKRCVETWGSYANDNDPSLVDGAPTHLADGRTPAKGIYHCKFEYGEDGYSEVVDSVTTHRYFANEHGKLDKTVSAGGIFGRTYDENGNLLSFVDPLGAVTTWVRDARGREIAITDPLGRTTLLERDSDGHIQRAVDPAGGVTALHRTLDGLVWTDPIGATFQVKLDGRGMLAATIAPNGGRTTYRHDDLGNMVEKTDATGATTLLAYDYWGRCLSIRDVSGATIFYTYDNRGNLTSVRRPDGGITRYQYDGAGDCTAIVGVNGHVTRLVRGGFQKLCEVQGPNGDITRYRYNREGRLVEIQNALGERHTFELDVAGLVTSERDFSGRITRYEYDGAGRLVAMVNGAGERAEYAYDAGGQLVSRTYHDGSSETFTYDVRGDLIEAKGPGGVFRYERNGVGWVVAETQILAGSEAVTVRRTYDVMGDVTERTTSLGHKARWVRSIGGQAASVLLDDVEEVRVAYDAAGRELSRFLPQGGRIDAAWDLMDRLTERRALSAVGRVAPGPGEPARSDHVETGVTAHRVYRYSAASELVETWDRTYGRRRYGYDAEHQLLASVPEDGRAEAYRYDPCRNLFDATTGAPAREYGPGNRLLSRGETEFRWDDAGRLTEAREAKAQGVDVTRYTWDAKGLLLMVEQPDGTVVEFAYDPHARRISKHVARRLANGEYQSQVATRFIWDGADLVHEIRRVAQRDGNPIVAERTYVFEDGAPWAHREGRGDGSREGAWFYYLNDETGAPESLVAGDGTSACELHRTAFGEATPAPGFATLTPIRFRGQYWDEETGLSYNRYRYYDPIAGRYISADPLGIYAGLNGFSYADNQPSRLVDPDGLMSKAGTTLVTADGKKQTGNSAFGGPLDPALKTAVDRAHEKFNDGRVPGKPPSAGQCAEIEALNKLATDIRNDRAKGGKRLKDPAREDIEVRREMREQIKGGKMVTVTNQDGQGMDPCRFCAQVFRELGLHPNNRGEVGRRTGVIGADGKAWNGNVWDKGGSKPFRHTQASSTPPFEGT